MPLILLAVYLISIFSLGFIALDVYLIHEWYLYKGTINNDYAWRCFIGAVALLFFMFSGRKIIAWLLSSKSRRDKNPQIEYSDDSEILERPDGSRIHIQYAGNKDGQAIIFIHGWNATSAEWYHQKKHLESRYRIILIDLPGLGKSTRPTNKDFSLLKMANDLNAVIHHCRLNNVILYGHSIGGMIILTYCTKVATTLSDIGGIILQHTTYTNPVKTGLFNKILVAIQKPILGPLCYLMIGLSPLFWISKWLSYFNGNMHMVTRFICFTGTQTPQQLDLTCKLSAMAPPAVFARGMLAMFDYDVTHELNLINVPTLIIPGNKDRLTLPEASHLLHKKIPHSRLSEVTPGGHLGLLERYEETNKAVQAFLEHLQNQTLKANRARSLTRD